MHPLDIRKYFSSRRHSKQDFLRRETFIASEGDAAINLVERNRNKKRLLRIRLPQKLSTWDRRLSLLFFLNTGHPKTILQEQFRWTICNDHSRNIGISRHRGFWAEVPLLVPPKQSKWDLFLRLALFRISKWFSAIFHENSSLNPFCLQLLFEINSRAISDWHFLSVSSSQKFCNTILRQFQIDNGSETECSDLLFFLGHYMYHVRRLVEIRRKMFEN